MVTLTFDDGPDSVGTPRILRELRAHAASSIFFVVAPRALAHPRLVRQMLDEGHEVGLHCWAHARHSTRTREAVADDTDRALGALAALGVRPRRWRTPWGDVAPWSDALADERDLALTGWSADTHDWRGDDADRMLAATLPALDPDAVVLMHDGIGPGARRGDCEETVRLLKPLCAAIRARGWTLGRPASVVRATA
jgi:peptidoglycan-N-acetylglucosamine deacetylase